MTYTNQEKVHQGRVHLSGLKHSLRSDGAPDDGGVVYDFGAVAGEALGVLRAA